RSIRYRVPARFGASENASPVVQPEAAAQRHQVRRRYIEGRRYAGTRRPWDHGFVHKHHFACFDIEWQLLWNVELRRGQHFHGKVLELNRLDLAFARLFNCSLLNTIEQLLHPSQPRSALFGESFAKNEHFSGSSHGYVEKPLFFLVLLVI